MNPVRRAPRSPTGRTLLSTPSERGNHGVNVLKPHLQTTIWTLLKGGATQREIARITGISRHTVRAYQQRFAADPANCPGVATDSGGQTAPPWPPTCGSAAPPLATSRCEPHRLPASNHKLRKQRRRLLQYNHWRARPHHHCKQPEPDTRAPDLRLDAGGLGRARVAEKASKT